MLKPATAGFLLPFRDSKCLLSLQRGRLLSQNKLKKFEKTLDRPVEVCYNGRKAPRRPRFRTSLLHFGAERHRFTTSLWHFGAVSAPLNANASHSNNDSHSVFRS